MAKLCHTLAPRARVFPSLFADLQVGHPRVLGFIQIGYRLVDDCENNPTYCRSSASLNMPLAKHVHRSRTTMSLHPRLVCKSRLSACQNEKTFVASLQMPKLLCSVPYSRRPYVLQRQSDEMAKSNSSKQEDANVKD